MIAGCSACRLPTCVTIYRTVYYLGRIRGLEFFYLHLVIVTHNSPKRNFFPAQSFPVQYPLFLILVRASHVSCTSWKTLHATLGFLLMLFYLKTIWHFYTNFVAGRCFSLKLRRSQAFLNMGQPLLNQL